MPHLKYFRASIRRILLLALATISRLPREVEIFIHFLLQRSQRRSAGASWLGPISLHVDKHSSAIMSYVRTHVSVRPMPPCFTKGLI